MHATARASQNASPLRLLFLRSAVVVAIAVAMAPQGLAHHILGIPHYAYDERYPQVPVLTYRVDAGAHEVQMTGYPGMPEPGEQCFLNIYIRDPRTQAPFDGVVQLQVTRDQLFGSDPIVYGPVQAQLEEAVYKFYPSFEHEANYTVRVSWESDGEPWVIDLPMVAGEPGSPWKVLAALVGGVAAFLLVVRALRIKSQRRARRGALRPELGGSAMSQRFQRAVRKEAST